MKSEPTLLLHQGRFLARAMQRQRVTRDEVISALRASGVARPEEAAGVVLETDGSLSVVQSPGPAGQPAEVRHGVSRPCEA